MFGWVLMALGALSGPAISLTIFLARVRKGQPHFRVFAIIAVLPLAVAVPSVIHDLSYPLINDVTTDVENPLALGAALESPVNVGRDMTFPHQRDARSRR
jgi:formate-dependent nitrite reductase membrane component NrfD